MNHASLLGAACPVANAPHHQSPALPPSGGGCAASATSVSSIAVTTVSAGGGNKRGQATVTLVSDHRDPQAQPPAASRTSSTRVPATLPSGAYVGRFVDHLRFAPYRADL